MSGWAPPSEFEEFRRLRPLGKGGMGEVWLFEDTGLHRSVAVKFIAGAEPGEDRRERFLTEARAIAQLTDPNVVAVYRAGEVAGRPYLVTEFVPGETLEALERPVPRLLLLQIGVGLASGLAAAHERGILHRDIKPSNAVLVRKGDDVVVKLLDFGLAKFFDSDPTTVSVDGSGRVLTRSGTLLGTPLYMAPECRRFEPATTRSDVYSLGAVLHELCTGSAASPQRTTRELLTSDPALATVIDRCLREDPAERYASAKDLLAALRALHPQTGLPLEGNPYRGLRAFDEQHRQLFFGREPEIGKVLDRLRLERFVLVAGDSGVGKSSLCGAGVVPFVRDGAIDAHGRASVLRLVPGRRPIHALAEAVAALRDENANALAAWLQMDPARLPDALPAIQGVSVILLFVDQIEELITIAERDEAAAFAAALAALAMSHAPARILAAVRGDFFTRLASLPGLGELVPGALFLLRPMTPERLRDSVVAPAEKAGLSFDPPEMVDEIVADAARAGGGLPLLQFTMAELWDARDVASHSISADALARLGGVAGALARHADDVIGRLLPAERAAARRILLRLLTAQGTRARASAAELGAEQSDARAALEALVQGRLVVAHEAEAGATEYEVAHEALLTGWGTLRAWIEADGDRRQIRARVGAAAAEWERLGRSREALWNRARLQESARVDRAELDGSQRAFLDESARSLRRTKRLRIFVLAAGPLLAAAVAASVRWHMASVVEAQVASRAAVGLQKFDDARKLDALATTEREEVLRSFQASTTQQQWDHVEAAWANVIEHRLAADAAYESAEAAFNSALAVNPRHAATRARVAETIVHRANLARLFGERRAFAKLARQLANVPDNWPLRSTFAAPAKLSIDVKPDGTGLSFATFEENGGKMQLLDAKPVGTTPVTLRDVPPGSHVLVFRDAGGREFRLPVLVDSGEELAISFTLPVHVPDGFIYVPPGRFLTGYGENEQIRRVAGEPPAHTASTAGYFISRDEVTFAEYVGFLESLDDDERTRRLPMHRSLTGAVELQKTPGGWKLMLQPTEHAFHARWGEPIIYPRRSTNAVQDWRKMPVLAISVLDATAYASWLSRTRVNGAHLCDDYEWERAARGADGREFTTGDRLSGTDANIDETYGRDPWSYGPDEVGSHPASNSVFGARDMIGNVKEMVILSRGGSGRVSIRGGGWYYGKMSARLPARFAYSETSRSATVGFRVCAPASTE